MPRCRRAAFVLSLASLSCDAKSEPEEPIEDGRAMVRAALLDGSSCYGETPLLCIDDPIFVDSAIDAALELRWKGEMPKTRQDIKSVIRSARAKYRDSMRSPVGLKTLERIVTERYNDPAIDTTTVPGIVAVDLGALPGELRASRRGAPVVLAKTDMLDGFEWKASEAGRQLAKYGEAHPQAKEIRVEVRYPASSPRHYVYRYLRESNRVVHEELEVGRSKTQYVSKPIEGGLSTLAAGKLRLGEDDGEHCYVGRTPGSSCRVADPYLAAKRDER